jgi:AcrR family transcriptional regulator
MPARQEKEKVQKRGRPISKRDDIVRAAVKTFLENGYAATSMNQVAREAGVIKATIYSHFKDKEQLFTAVIEEVVLKKAGLDFSELEKQLIAMPVDQFFEQLYGSFRKIIEDNEYGRLIRVVIGESGRFPEIADLYLSTVVLKGMELGRKYFEVHPELGIKDPLAAAHVACGSFWSLFMWQRLLGGQKYVKLEPERVKKVVQEMIKALEKA